MRLDIISCTNCLFVYEMNLMKYLTQKFIYFLFASVRFFQYPISMLE